MNALPGLFVLLLFGGLATWMSLRGDGASLEGPSIDAAREDSVSRVEDPDAASGRLEVEGAKGAADDTVHEPVPRGAVDLEPTNAELVELSRATEPGVVEGLVLVGRTPLATGGRVLHAPGYLVTMRGPGETDGVAPEPTAVPIDGNGEFRLHGLSPGPHTVAVDLGRGPRQATSFEVVEGERGRRLVIVLGTARVFGQLWDPEGRPLAGVRVTVSRTANRPFVTSCISAADGRYAVEDLPAGECWFTIEPAAAGGGGFELMQKISLAIGEARRLDVGSPTGAATVSGRVLLRDGSPALGGGRLHLQRKSDRAYSEVPVDAAGAFTAPVPAGEYEVAVSFDGGEVARWQVAELAVGRADVAKDFVVGATQVVGVLTAVATGLPPEGIERSRVYVLRAEGSVLASTVAIDRTGRFVVGGLGPGRYRISIHPAALESGPHEFEVGPDAVVLPLALTTKGR